jgi:leader peptidase (prepilin peptidase)/N-methyltransferase
MSYAELSVLGVLGLVVGSFLGSLVVRVPRGQPLLLARSACPHCGHQLAAIELIPVASWIFQNRRCRVCRTKLSAFYPVIEIAAATISVAAGWWLQGLWIIAGCFTGWLILALAAWGWSSFGAEETL